MKTPSVNKKFRLTGDYKTSVAAYGEPPSGFRFLKIGEATNPKTCYYWRCGSWQKETEKTIVKSYHVPMIVAVRESTISQTKKSFAPTVSAEVQTLLAKAKMLENSIATAQSALDKIKEAIRGLT